MVREWGRKEQEQELQQEQEQEQISETQQRGRRRSSSSNNVVRHEGGHCGAGVRKGLKLVVCFGTLHHCKTHVLSQIHYTSRLLPKGW
jgi:hypothetical protein